MTSGSAAEEGLALISKDAPDELAESEESRLLAAVVPLLFCPLAAAATRGTTRLPSPSRTIGMSLSLGDDEDEAAAITDVVAIVLLPVTDEDGELLPGVDG